AALTKPRRFDCCLRKLLSESYRSRAPYPTLEWPSAIRGADQVRLRCAYPAGLAPRPVIVGRKPRLRPTGRLACRLSSDTAVPAVRQRRRVRSAGAVPSSGRDTILGDTGERDQTVLSAPHARSC